MSDTLRLFVGIEVGDAWATQLSRTVECLRGPLGRAVRWVRPELYHLTVVFLGDQPSEMVALLDDALAEATAALAPFPLELTEMQRLGAHGHGALVAGVHDVTGQLQRLRVRVDAALNRRAIAYDAKRLVPHVTLGRPRGRGGPLPTPRVDLRHAPPLTVASVHLVHSDLSAGGPRYARLLTTWLAER